MTGSSAIQKGATARSARASLTFALGGGGTVLTHQITPYPFHITRPFHLDRGRPDISTLYLQSASGGVYQGDDLRLDIVARRGAGAHVTTQSATIVHQSNGPVARQRTTLEARDGAFLAYTPDPLVLFPGSSLCNETIIRIAPSARAIVQDGFAWHDPRQARRAFDTLTQRLEIVDDSGRLLVREHGTLAGADFLSENSPLGPFRTAGSMLILAPAEAESPPVAASILRACEMAGCLGGIGKLPNRAGLLLRCIARDGGALRAGLEAAFVEAFAILVGERPGRRRK